MGAQADARKDVVSSRRRREEQQVIDRGRKSEVTVAKRRTLR